MLFGKRSKSLAEDEDMVKNYKKVVPFLEECPVDYNREAFFKDIEQEFEKREKEWKV